MPLTKREFEQLACAISLSANNFEGPALFRLLSTFTEPEPDLRFDVDGAMHIDWPKKEADECPKW